jgi:hypothetical protein
MRQGKDLKAAQICYAVKPLKLNYSLCLWHVTLTESSQLFGTATLEELVPNCAPYNRGRNSCHLLVLFLREMANIVSFFPYSTGDSEC